MKKKYYIFKQTTNETKSLTNNKKMLIAQKR